AEPQPAHPRGRQPLLAAGDGRRGVLLHDPQGGQASAGGGDLHRMVPPPPPGAGHEAPEPGGLEERERGDPQGLPPPRHLRGRSPRRERRRPAQGLRGADARVPAHRAPARDERPRQQRGRRRRDAGRPGRAGGHAPLTGTERARRSGPGALPYLLVGPLLALIALFVLYPMAEGVWVSLYDSRDLVPRHEEFAGLLNYRWLARSPATLTAIRVTVVYVVVTTVAATTVGLASALVLDAPFRGRAL